MKSVRRAVKTNKKVAKTIQRGTRNVIDGAILATAAHRVVAARTKIATAGMLDLTKIDHSELARIVPEKVSAFSASTILAANETLRTVAKVGNYAMNEWVALNRTALTLATARTPLAAGLAQSNSTYAWWARMVTHSAELANMMTRSQKAVSEPIQRAAHANAARLSH